MRFSKNASLNLSINAIVILILAITMLGLGLGFMKNLFSKTTGQLADVGEDIKNQMISELRRSNAKLTLDQEDITIKTGNTKDIYFGVKNVLTEDNEFGITIDCKPALNQADTGFGQKEKDMMANIKTFDTTRLLSNGEIDVQKMQINLPSTFDPTTWPCKITLGIGGVIGTALTPDNTYTSKSFFITVER